MQKKKSDRPPVGPFARPVIAAARTALMLGAACFAAAAQAQASRLADLSLEQLTSIEVTSVGKRLQRVADVAGTVFIIRSEDIRRSGASSLTEALRLAPNLMVARADASQYAVTARSGADLLANKMLVLMDGRTVYSPLFSGVFWEAQEVVLEDIERIEVLAGSGGTLYGSNAFNGVINIITRSAGETQGLLTSVDAGNQERAAAVRYGGTSAGGIHWRAYAKRRLVDASRRAGGASAHDAAGHSLAGFRLDQGESSGQYTVQGEVSEHQIDEPVLHRRYTHAHLLARYSRELGDGSRTQVQAFFDRSLRDRLGNIRDTMDTWDVELQHQSRPRSGHDLLWGAGWRQHSDEAVNYNPAVAALRPADRRLQLWNAFAQDEVKLGEHVKFTAGFKAERNGYTGVEFLPSLRLGWQLAPESLAWAAASRTVRTPSRVDREVFSPPLVGGPDFISEVAKVYELGLRSQIAPGTSVSTTVFHHDFERLRSLDLTPAGATFNNNYSGRLNGFMAWGDARLSPTLRMRASYYTQRTSYEARPGTSPLLGAASLGNDPRYRGMLSVAWDLGHSMELDLSMRRTGALPSPAVPAYTAVDARFGWRPRPELELSVAVRNLSDRSHAEWGAPATRAEIGRSVQLKAVWRQ
jgi:iron complex outermembrane receptor protein